MKNREQQIENRQVFFGFNAERTMNKAMIDAVKSKRAVAQTDFVLRQAQHERKKVNLSNTIPFTLSLSKGEQ